jgi:Carboxypeptidase regulatory-like domain/TonB-dependent Receptor Plug Domain
MRFHLFVCIFVSVAVIALFAQSSNGNINGLVSDASSAAIAGAEIVAVNDVTGVQYTTKTNGDGIYVFPNLPPGPYRLQVSKVGFKTIIKPDIVVNVANALSMNFTLPVGALHEIVTVAGGAPLINTESGSVSTVVDRNFVENLPLNGRSFNTLLQLTPGVVIAQSPSNYAPGQFSIAGQRTDANNFTVDGVSANFGVQAPGSLGESGTGSAQAFSALGSTSSLASVDALQEFRVETSSFAPEFGRSPGGQVLLTTRSGANIFHGGLFDYFRNTVMDANDWFADHAGEPRAAEHHNDFGGFLGGPLWKNKTFFFFSYEGARLDEPQTQPIQVPSAYARSIASSTLAPFVNAYPEPDDRTITPGVYTSTFTGNYSNTATLNATSLRIDQVLSDRFSVFARYNYAPSRTAGPAYSLSTFQTSPVNTQTLTAGVNMFLTTRVANALRGNYSVQSAGIYASLDSLGGAVPLDPQTILGSLSSNTNIGVFGTFDTQYLIFGSQGENKTRQANLVDDLTVSVGLHQLKFGADYRAIFLDANSFQHEPQYLGSSVQSFLSTGTVSLSTATRVPARILAQSQSLYAQDTWKANSRLTLTYGIRWELDPAPSALGRTNLASWENVDDPSKIALAASGTRPWGTTYSNFAPRIGLAYSLTAKGDFVLRAGGGLFYDLGVGSVANLAFTFPNASFSFSPSVSVPITNLVPYLPVISTDPPYPEAVQGFAPNLELPRSYQWNLAIEKSFSGEQAVSATYVGQSGRNLLRQEALYQPNANFVGDLILNVNGAYSNYHALQLQYRRPLSSRAQALLSYSWSHSLDNASNDAVAALSNVVISAANDYASSDFDVRQSFSGALSLRLPAARKSRPLAAITQEWSLETVAVARTGFPFNGVVLVASPDPTGFALSRPDLSLGQPLWIENKSAPGGKSLNSNAFSVPSTPRQGTEGRNDIPGFGMTQIDLSIARKFPIGDRFNLQFRADAFNFVNHPNFSNPLAYVEFGPSYLSSTAMLNRALGGLTSLFQQGGPRSLQLSLKLNF